MTENVSGEIKAISRKKSGAYGVKIGEEWFNGKDQSDLKGINVGDSAIIGFEKDGQWNNVQSIELLESQPVSDVVVPDWPAKDRKITRMSCLKSAVEFFNMNASCLAEESKPVPEASVLKLAEKFEAWVYR
jgi:hypothetical protein